MSKLQQIWAMREASNTRRCHTTPHHGEYTVGKHSFDALNLLLVLHPAPSLNLIKAVCWHDFAERWVGDSPSPGLRHFDRLNALYKEAEEDVLTYFVGTIELTEVEKSWLLAVDRLELLFWALFQQSLGNKNVDAYIPKILGWLNEGYFTQPDEIRDLIDGELVFLRNSDCPGEFMREMAEKPIKDDEIPF